MKKQECTFWVYTIQKVSKELDMQEICKSTFTGPVEATIQLIGGKYKAVILWHLMNDTLRYNDCLLYTSPTHETT